MSIVMMIGPNDCPFVRARVALTRAKAAGVVPVKWLMGKGVHARLTRNHTGTPDTLYGYPFEIVKPTPRKPSAPPDLLELDVF